MKLKNLFKIFFIVISLSVSDIYAQCSGCTVSVINNSTTNYTVSVGQQVCINSGITYLGTITLNGGTICNYGSISKIIFLKGTFNNYYSFISSGNVSTNPTGNVIINCFSSSKTKFSGNLDYQSLNSNDSLIFNLNEGCYTSIDKNLTAMNGNLNINYGNNQKGYCLFNVGKDLNIGSTCNFKLRIPNQSGVFNVAKTMSFDNKGNKSIVNDGTFNIGKSFNIGGNGLSTNVIKIINNGNFNITNFFTISYNNGTVNIVNNASGKKLMQVGKTYTQSKPTTAFTNNGSFFVAKDLNVEKGLFTNNARLQARDIDVKQGTFTNATLLSSVTLTGDLITSNTNGIINNSGSIVIANELNNIGTINISTNSILYTRNYYNTNNGAITGPASIIPDTSSYPKIIITDTSSNSGYLNGRMLIWDQTLSNNNNAPIGFDSYSNGSRIGGVVIFVPFPTLPISTFYCRLISLLNPIIVSANPNPVCFGANSILNAQLYNSLSSPITLPSNTYTWQPGTLVGQNQTVVVTTAQIYTVNVKYLRCTLKKTISVTTFPNPVVAITSNLSPACLNSGLVLSSPAIAGAISYQWYNGINPISGEISVSFIPTAIGSYYLKVTNSTNCSSNSNTITVLTSPVVNINPSATNICSGASVILTANVTSGVITTYQWQLNGANIGTNLPNYSTTLAGDYNVVVTNSNGCSVTSPILNITQSSPILFAPPYFISVFANSPFGLGGTPLVSGGTPPYIYNWTQTSSGFTSSSENPSISNGIISSTSYNVVVSDVNGCSQSQIYTVGVTNSKSYAVLKKELDASYYMTINGKLYFSIEGDYNQTGLDYKIYNFNRSLMNGLPINNTFLENGDNRFNIDVTGLSVGFYILEVVNQKHEKLVLRFKI